MSVTLKKKAPAQQSEAPARPIGPTAQPSTGYGNDFAQDQMATLDGGEVAVEAGKAAKGPGIFAPPGFEGWSADTGEGQNIDNGAREVDGAAASATSPEQTDTAREGAITEQERTGRVELCLNLAMLHANPEVREAALSYLRCQAEDIRPKDEDYLVQLSHLPKEPKEAITAFSEAFEAAYKQVDQNERLSDLAAQVRDRVAALLADDKYMHSPPEYEKTADTVDILVSLSMVPIEVAGKQVKLMDKGTACALRRAFSPDSDAFRNRASETLIAAAGDHLEPDTLDHALGIYGKRGRESNLPADLDLLLKIAANPEATEHAEHAEAILESAAREMDVHLDSTREGGIDFGNDSVRLTRGNIERMVEALGLEEGRLALRKRKEAGEQGHAPSQTRNTASVQRDIAE